MDRGAWWATIHGVAKSRTRPSDFTFTHFHLHVPDTFRACKSFLVTTGGCCPFCYSCLSTFLVFLIIKSERPRSTWYPPTFVCWPRISCEIGTLIPASLPFLWRSLTQQTALAADIQ